MPSRCTAASDSIWIEAGLLCLASPNAVSIEPSSLGAVPLVAYRGSPVSVYKSSRCALAPNIPRFMSASNESAATASSKLSRASSPVISASPKWITEANRSRSCILRWLMVFSEFCGSKFEPKAMMAPVMIVMATMPITRGLWKIPRLTASVSGLDSVED